jgi:anti-anti-sigma factor
VSFAYARSSTDGSNVLELHGEMDISSAPEFAVAALAALNQMHAQSSPLVLDVSRLTFMDCAGVGALMATRRAASARGCRVVLTGSSGSVQKLLRLMAVESLFLLDAPTIVLPRDDERRQHLRP